MKRIICFVVAVLMLFSLCSCAKKKAKADISFEDDLWSSVKDYETTAMEDGTVAVTLVATDYRAIISYLEEKGNLKKITEEKVIQVAKEHPEMVKEYSFSAENSEEEVVKAALVEQVVYDLVAITLEKMEK